MLVYKLSQTAINI